MVKMKCDNIFGGHALGIALGIMVLALMLAGGTVSAVTLESVKTTGQAVPAPVQVPEQKYATTATFTSFNIDVMGLYRSGSAITPDGRTVYVMNYDPTVSVIDATINRFVKRIDLSSASPGMLSGGVVVGNKLYAVGSSRSW